MPAKFIASCHCPLAVEPSPKKVIATRGSPRILKARAMPVATWAMSGSMLTMPTQPRARSPKCMFPSRPPVTPPVLPM
jgi:hypothetical protein